MARKTKSAASVAPRLLSTVSPSQYANLGWLIITIATVFIPYVAAFFLLIYLYRRLDYSFWEYRFYDDYVIEKKGIFNVSEEMVNYFRIKSIKVEQPFWMRLFGLSIIHVTTSEQFKPFIKFYAIENAQSFVDFLQSKTKLKRKENGIRDVDVFYS
jgi:uncharacterized membrane protein YdbT with pleckstrin-like domain